jgi:hypothetical protein
MSAKQEKQLVKEAEMEFKRRGRFKRVFPTVDYHYYKQFFTEERYLNQVLDQKIMNKRRLNLNSLMGGGAAGGGANSAQNNSGILTMK